ncbi:hypothetical protein FGO68_gene1481 [Halteria grandinella]|uniref:Uncharacterized protein n=1 Tax=Halteria grandinella TaxID=5974 RepID=A0A8J8NXL4_HALGN|nr:hypothetical protein FGO68_gene1481 [Halteria grandinella]
MIFLNNQYYSTMYLRVYLLANPIVLAASLQQKAYSRMKKLMYLLSTFGKIMPILLFDFPIAFWFNYSNMTNAQLSGRPNSMRLCTDNLAKQAQRSSIVLKPH